MRIMYKSGAMMRRSFCLVKAMYMPRRKQPRYEPFRITKWDIIRTLVVILSIIAMFSIEEGFIALAIGALIYWWIKDWR